QGGRAVSARPTFSSTSTASGSPKLFVDLPCAHGFLPAYFRHEPGPQQVYYEHGRLPGGVTPMRRHGRTGVCAAVVLAVASVVAFAPSAAARQAAHSPAQAAAKPKATEIGVTATTIRIAVIADVNTPLAPGLFKAAPDAV